MRSANVLVSGCVAGLLVISRSSWAQTVPQSFTLTGTLRDFPSESSHPDFGAFPPATPGAKSAKNISTTLDTDQKPVYVGQGKKVTDEWQCANGHIIGWCQPPMPGDVPGVLTVDDDGGITNGVTFSQWFRDVPGVNMSRLWPITLEKENVDGGDDDEGGGNDSDD